MNSSSSIDSVVLGRVDLNQWVQSTTIQSLLFISYNQGNSNNASSASSTSSSSGSLIHSFTFYPTHDYHHITNNNAVVFDIPENREYMQIAPYNPFINTSKGQHQQQRQRQHGDCYIILALDTSDPSVSISAELYFFSTTAEERLLKRFVFGTNVMQAELALPLAGVFT
jgi:hypothetical protein